MSGVRAAAAALRAASAQLPIDVVERLDGDLVALTELLNETLATSCRQQDVISGATSLRSGLTESLTGLLNNVDRAISDKATQFEQLGAPAGATMPPEVSRKVQQLLGKPPPKTSDKEINGYLREITSQGWVVEKTHGGHLKVWGPDGEGPRVFSSTPSGRANNRKLRALVEQIIRQNHRKDTST